MEHPESIARALRGVKGVFSVQPLLLGKRTKMEVAWGKSLADQARLAGVTHLVYSSVFGAASAQDVPHFASKHEIETHIESIGMPYTILQPAGFMENLLLPIVRKGIAKGKLTLANAIDAPQHLIAVDDIGAMAATALMQPTDYVGMKIPLVAEVASTRQQAEILSRGLGWDIKPQQLPALVVRVFIGRDLQRMFRWNDRHAASLPFDIEKVLTARPELLSFEAWCRRHASLFGSRRPGRPPVSISNRASR
jgi:uncharacterized protein YbjT (DUF2867 family)